jgi:hypothetical protein
MCGSTLCTWWSLWINKQQPPAAQGGRALGAVVLAV